MKYYHKNAKSKNKLLFLAILAVGGCLIFSPILYTWGNQQQRSNLLSKLMVYWMTKRIGDNRETIYTCRVSLTIETQLLSKCATKEATSVFPRCRWIGSPISSCHLHPSIHPLDRPSNHLFGQAQYVRTLINWVNRVESMHWRRYVCSVVVVAQ